jgi:superfamily I DNA/RNA helicase
MGEQAFRLIRAIVPEKTGGDRNSIFIVGDAHQHIYGRRATMTACGINVRGRSRQLRLNYRTSDEIRKWAVSVLEGVPVDDLDEGADSLKGYTSAFRGPAPELASFSSEEKEVGALVEWILAVKAQGTLLGDIGVLLRTTGQIDGVARKLADAGLESIKLRPNMSDDRRQPGVRLSTMHCALDNSIHIISSTVERGRKVWAISRGPVRLGELSEQANCWQASARREFRTSAR